MKLKDSYTREEVLRMLSSLHSSIGRIDPRGTDASVTKAMLLVFKQMERLDNAKRN